MRSSNSGIQSHPTRIEAMQTIVSSQCHSTSKSSRPRSLNRLLPPATRLHPPRRPSTSKVQTSSRPLRAYLVFTTTRRKVFRLIRSSSHQNPPEPFTHSVYPSLLYHLLHIHDMDPMRQSRVHRRHRLPAGILPSLCPRVSTRTTLSPPSRRRPMFILSLHSFRVYPPLSRRLRPRIHPLLEVSNAVRLTWAVSVVPHVLLLRLSLKK